MDATRQTDDKQATKGGPLPGLLRPSIVFLAAILLGIALNRARSLPFLPSALRLLGPLVTLCAVLRFAWLALGCGEASAPLRSCEPVPTGSVAIPFIYHSSFSCSNRQFG